MNETPHLKSKSDESPIQPYVKKNATPEKHKVSDSPTKTTSVLEPSTGTDDQDYQEELRQLRATVKIPYLEPLPENLKMFTLVLDLDETLIHFQPPSQDEPDEEGFYMIRPGCNKFLRELSKHYEIVVFTAAMPDYADWILDQIDEVGYVASRLYRQHCTPKDDYAIKDLRNLGRDLRKTIIVDNLAENFSMTPTNGIWVESWYDDLDCQVLPTLQTFLIELVKADVEDVRAYLTPETKKILYSCMESGTPIPSLPELLPQKS